jgi:hypothetical protein
MRKFAGIVILLSLFLAACSANLAGAPRPGSVGAVPTAAAPINLSVAPGGNTNAPREQPIAPKDRIILTSVSIMGIADNPDQVIVQLGNLATELGGWVVSSQTNAVADVSGSGGITMRVPAVKMQEALTRIRATLKEVKKESSSGQDVTQDFVDTTSQIANLEAAQASLKKIMDEAKTTEDVLKVFNQLTAIQSQLETAKGKIKYWSEASAYALVTVSLSKTYVPSPVAQPAGWTPATALQSGLDQLTRLTQGLVDVLIYLGVVFLPFALPLGLAWFGWRQLRRKLKVRA